MAHPRPWPLILLLALLLSACGGSAPAPSAPLESAGTSADSAQIPQAAAAPTMAAEAPAAAAEAPAPNAMAQQPEATPPAGPPLLSDPSRKIVKDATIAIEVASVVSAMSRIGADAATLGGYVLETRSELGQQPSSQASVRVAVPVDQFEGMLERIRETADSVLSEQASGTDVTQEFVDVRSKLDNLEATQARIREFLDQATSVEESLRVNAQLSEIEGQIGQLKGRLEFLSQRAAYSTIAVQLRQTPQASPTPEPTPLPDWEARKTAQEAYATLSVIVQALVTVVIWLAIVVLPLALPAALVGLGLRAWARRGRTP
jgi:hypothetical protein